MLLKTECNQTIKFSNNGQEMTIQIDNDLCFEAYLIDWKTLFSDYFMQDGDLIISLKYNETTDNFMLIIEEDANKATVTLTYAERQMFEKIIQISVELYHVNNKLD